MTLFRTSLIMIALIFLAACSNSGSTEEIILSGATEIAEGEDTISDATAIGNVDESFNTMMSVLTHPRCINCHPADDQPRQRDEQVVHILNVTRGEADHGSPVQDCATCHHEENNSYSRIPGAPHWQLAPLSMGWLGLSEREIAQALIDTEKNGDRSFEDLIHHMEVDPLVLWAWEPGEGRTVPPVSHEQFVQSLETWLAAGAPLPEE